MPPWSGHAASSSKPVAVCMVLQVPRNLASNLIASHLHWGHSEKRFIVNCRTHRWQHAIYLQAVASLVVLKMGCLHRLVFAEVCGFKEPFPKQDLIQWKEKQWHLHLQWWLRGINAFLRHTHVLCHTWAQQPVDIIFSIWSPLPPSFGKDGKQCGIPFCIWSVCSLNVAAPLALTAQ